MEEIENWDIKRSSDVKRERVTKQSKKRTMTGLLKIFLR
jgi:hypothetical protein